MYSAGAHDGQTTRAQAGGGKFRARTFGIWIAPGRDVCGPRVNFAEFAEGVILLDLSGWRQTAQRVFTPETGEA
jgi:hypothetical protein